MNAHSLNVTRLKIVGALVIAAAAILIVSLQGAAATSTTPCDQSAGPVGCVDISLGTPGLTADFYVGDTLAAPGVSAARLNVKPYKLTHITARNVQDGAPAFGDVYVYNQPAWDVYVGTGGIYNLTLTPVKVYLKGFLSVPCNIAGTQPGDSVACRVTIAGGVQPDLLAGQTGAYNLTPGIYQVHVALAGDQAYQWWPAALDSTIAIQAGLTQTITTAFDKQNLVTFTLDQPGIPADFYANGQLIAQQVTSAQTWLPPNQTSLIEVKNFTDPAALEYKWDDLTSSLKLTAGEVKTVTLTMHRTFSVGWIDVGCQLTDLQPEDNVVCTIIYDGQPLLHIAPGVRGKWSATPGPHTLTIILEGDNTLRWQFAPTLKVNVVAGQLFQTTLVFNLAPPTPAPPPAVVTGLGLEVMAVYQHGLQLGNNPHAFSKVGDCETYSPDFLQPIASGTYYLGTYGYLQATINYFSGSFDHVGQAARNGMPAHALLDPLWADPNVCNPDESPLACEYRTHRPVIALVMARTADYGNGPGSQFDTDMRKIVQYSIDHGVIPVLSTVPYQGSPHPDPYELNATIRQIAADTHMPLWDFWNTTETLPNRGVDSTYHLTLPPGSEPTYFTAGNMQFGMTRRNLEALQVLQTILHQVMQQ